MIPIDLKGKVALVTGVGDDDSFAWYISKALNAAGAKIVLASHPRMVGIVESFLSRDMDKESRKLPYVEGELKVEKVYPLDARFDSMADVDEATKNDKRWNKYEYYGIKEVVDAVGKEFGGIDILIHSVAFAKEIKSRQLETTRAGYYEAIGISAYSLTSMLRAAEPYMENRPGGASAVGLTYLGGSRVVPYYGGGMSTEGQQIANGQTHGDPGALAPEMQMALQHAMAGDPMLAQALMQLLGPDAASSLFGDDMGNEDGMAQQQMDTGRPPMAGPPPIPGMHAPVGAVPPQSMMPPPQMPRQGLAGIGA